MGIKDLAQQGKTAFLHEEMQVLLHVMTDVALVLDEEGRYLKVLPTNPAMLYRVPEEVLGRTLHEIFPSEQADFFLGYVKETLASQKIVDLEYSLNIREKIVWFSARMAPLSDTTVFLVARDITEHKQAEEAAVAWKRRYELVAQAALQVVYESDADTGEVTWSDSMRTVLGYTGDDLADGGRRVWLENIAESDRLMVFQRIEEAGREKRPFDIEYTFYHKDGRELLIRDRGEYFFDDTGKMRHLVGVMQDVTHRAEEEKRLQFAMLSLENCPDSVYWVNSAGKILYTNPAACRELGYSLDELMNMYMWEIDPNYKKEAWGADGFVWRVLRSQKIKVFESVHQRRDGHLIPMEIVIIEVVYKGQSFMTSICRDIERRKETEQALHEAKDLLEGKVEERTQALFAANQELSQRIEEMKLMQAYLVRTEKIADLDLLVAGIAHEISNPVGVGVTAASHLEQITRRFHERWEKETLRRREMEEYLEDIRESTEIIYANLERAARLIRSFKQLSADQSSEQQRVFAVKSYLEEILVSMQPKLKKTKVIPRIECPEDLIIKGFPGAFSQVITNLVMNSLLHAYKPGESGSIYIRVSTEGDFMILDYSDDGRGMRREVLDKIFDPFFTTKQGEGGTGLGLYVLQNIVTQQFQGSVACNSEEGKGTRFLIRFPFQSNM